MADDYTTLPSTQLPSLTEDDLGILSHNIFGSTAGTYYTTINTGGTSINYPSLGSGTYTTNGTGYGNPLIYSNPNSASIKVEGDAEFNGDVTIKGKSILTILESIEKRLAILNPDPKKLEKYEALKKAYQHYKTLEALCDIQDKESNGL